MPALKPGTLLPNTAQDAAITAAAVTDVDAVPYTDDQWATIKPRVGRPPLAAPKQAVKVRLDADILSALRASGRGWQTRVNALLKEAVQTGKFAA